MLPLELFEIDLPGTEQQKNKVIKPNSTINVCQCFEFGSQKRKLGK